jgi:cysteine desulfurase
MKDEQTRVAALRDRFEAMLLGRVPETLVNGDCERRLPNTSSLSFVGIAANAALLMLDQHHLCCSPGSACHAGSSEASHVLQAMNLGEERSRGSLRFSFGRFNTEAEVDQAAEIIPRVIAKLRALSPRQTAAVVSS